jgi:AcrR family transcriptional regulator
MMAAKNKAIALKRNAADTRLRILNAATRHFGEKGFDGARVDTIAQAARTNKQLLYHYFGNKDALFAEALERAYQQLREQESELNLDALSADQAILALLDFTWKFYLDHPDFIRLLNSENQMHARHLKASQRISKINSQHLKIHRTLIERGQNEKTVRGDLDPLQLSINIASLGFFYLINRHTLSTVFKSDLNSPRMLRKRLDVMRDVVARWIRPAAN